MVARLRPSGDYALESILVVDDMSIFREPIAAMLQSAGFQTECAADGEEALRRAREIHPDLILLDIAMPGMDGITFLKRLRAEPKISDTKVILLSMHNEKPQILAARALGAKDYILKTSFRYEDFFERIKKTVSATESAISGATVKTQERRSPLLTREKFLEKVSSAFHAKTLSGIVAEVVTLAGSPRGDATELANLISRDPVLSARVLQTANSAQYASRGPAITTIPDAIRKVGFATVRNIGAALGVFDHMPEASADGFNPIRYWQHSFAVAQICERLCTGKFPEKAGTAYVVGLCHDLGEIFMRTEFGSEYEQVIQAADQPGASGSRHCMMKLLGVTPAQIVGAILKSMSLPQVIREAIELFHGPDALRSKNPLTQILWMAENYANAAMLASGSISEVAPLTQAFCRGATGEMNPHRLDPEKLHSQVLSLTAALARLSRADEQKLLAPTFKSEDRKIWIVREAGVSEFDPIALACESLMQVSVSVRLPSEREIEGIDAIFVIASSKSGCASLKSGVESTLPKIRKDGPELPLFFLACADAIEHKQIETPWRTSVALRELAELAGSSEKCKSK